MSQDIGHKFELFSDTHDAFHLETVFLGEADKALFGPESLVVDIKNAKCTFALVHLDIAEIPGQDNLEDVFDANKIREREKDMAFRSQMLLAEIDEVYRIVHMFQHVAHDYQVELAVFFIVFVKHMVVFVKTAREIIRRLAVGTVATL